MANIRFTETKLKATGKSGVLTPDADGYYEIVVGGLNAVNSAGEYYVYNEAAALFQESSILMRRIKNGVLKGENGHPAKLPNMSMDQYVNRVLKIDEGNICCHIKEITLDTEYGRKNPHLGTPELVAIIAKLKPAGPRGPYLKEALDNPNEDVCFSIRALTNDFYQRGKTIRVLVNIITWDWVVEPGISIASKYSSPSLESIVELSLSQSILERIMADTAQSVATEDSRAIITQTLELMTEPVKQAVPIYKHW